MSNENKEEKIILTDIIPVEIDRLKDIWWKELAVDYPNTKLVDMDMLFKGMIYIAKEKFDANVTSPTNSMLDIFLAQLMRAALERGSKAFEKIDNNS